jgi:CheY-like chemotaxis protein
MQDKKTILVIDDDKDIVESTRIILESNGYAVATAFDYEEGWQKVTSVIPDLVVLDAMLLMHQKSGFELSTEIRKDPRTRNIPILMVSAVNEVPGGFAFSPDSAGEGVSVDDFIDKPALPKVLLPKIQRLLASGPKV